MMSVIVNHRDAFGFAFELKTPVGIFEFAEGFSIG